MKLRKQIEKSWSCKLSVLPGADGELGCRPKGHTGQCLSGVCLRQDTYYTGHASLELMVCLPQFLSAGVMGVVPPQPAFYLSVSKPNQSMPLGER